MEKVLLAFDCGTQSLRAMLFDPAGELLAKAKVAYEPYLSPNPGWAEQDPELYWRSLCTACLTLKAEHPGLFAAIAGIAVTTLRDSLINVDRQGRPLRPAILWLDQRKAESRARISTGRKLAYSAVGMREAVAVIEHEAKANWIRQNQPDVWENTHKYLQVSGFLNYRLTGVFVDSAASQIGHVPFDHRRRTWARAGDIKSLIMPVEREKEPDLVEPGALIGTVTDRAANETGLMKGLPVVAAGSDKGCETIGVGCVSPDAASLSFGTTATIQTTSRRYFEPIRFMPAYTAALPGYYNPEVEIFRGYWMISWFKQEFGEHEMVEAMRTGEAPEVLLNRLLETVPAGSMGLVIQPYWSPGLKTPEAKGAMIGFGDVHSRAHIYRAIIEGLGYALLDGMHHIERAGGVRIRQLMVSGGGSQSDDICQITADIFDRPVNRGATHEAAGLGAAIVAAVGIGIHSDFRRAIDWMVRYTRTFTPREEFVRVYHSLYEDVYAGLYDTLKPLYRRIRAITGYPESAL